MTISKGIVQLFLYILPIVLYGCSVSPTPLGRSEVEDRVLSDLRQMLGSQPSVDEKPISLYDAMARAIKYNLDHRLKLMEEALESRELDVARFDLLPQITASAGYKHRSNEFGSYSESLIDGTQSLVASTSQERKSRVGDISVMWNILDFGVSYARAKQKTDRILIVEERRRKVVQNIIQDVRYAYWRAVIAERLIKDMVSLLDRTKSALERSRRISGERLQPPKDVLEYQRALLENIRLLWGIIQKLTPARVELATLMNLPPGTAFKLVEPDWDEPEIPVFNTPVEKLEYLALVSRPELREEDYKTRISALEIKKSILKMLPGVNFDFSANYDSNDYLFNQNWWDASAFITQNIIKIASGPATFRNIKAQQELDALRRQALSMAVLMQVHLAYQRYHLVQKEFHVARKLDEVNIRLNTQTLMEEQAGSASELAVIQSSTNALVARMRHYISYAELQNAAGRIYNSLGIDPLPGLHSATDLIALSRNLQSSFKRWQRIFNVSMAGRITRQDYLSVDIPTTSPATGKQMLSSLVDEKNEKIREEGKKSAVVTKLASYAGIRGVDEVASGPKIYLDQGNLSARDTGFRYQSYESTEKKPANTSMHDAVVTPLGSKSLPIPESEVFDNYVLLPLDTTVTVPLGATGLSRESDDIVESGLPEPEGGRVNVQIRAIGNSGRKTYPLKSFKSLINN